MKLPRYSLRTLFVAVTAFSLLFGWLAWQASIVHHRQAMLSIINQNGGRVFESGEFDLEFPDQVKTIRRGDAGYQISQVRKWFGDKLIFMVLFNRQLTGSDRQTIEAFPEAEVMAIP
jgi:hypothetical protein